MTSKPFGPVLVVFECLATDLEDDLSQLFENIFEQTRWIGRIILPKCFRWNR